MASVFLSYDHEDADRAATIAAALDKGGHSVWWDRHIHGGAEYNSMIEEAVASADAVVVLWSKSSIRSAWVRDEAAEGRDRGKLVPMLIDAVKPPMGFRQYQTIDLSSWKGRGRPPGLDQLVRAIESLENAPSERDTTLKSGPATVQRQKLKRGTWVILAVVAVTLLLGSALGALRLVERTSVPTVAVAAADPSAQSQALARDLLVTFGSLSVENSGAMRLIEHDDRSETALVLKVGGASRPEAAEASLALFDGKDRSLLWSKEIEQPSGNRSDLEQQIGFTAARVAECALEGLNSAGRRLPQQTLKLYLTGCATLAEVSGGSSAEISKVVQIFRRVTQKSPRFVAAWAKLLLAETELASLTETELEKSFKAQFLADIAAARTLNPNLAEAYLAEAQLTSRAAFLERSRLLDLAVEHNPGSAVAHSLRSSFLQSVGRMGEAVEDGRRSAELDPLSPAARDAMISTLAYSGNLAAANAELEKAERLWPRASGLVHARYRLELRYGDPRRALEMLRSGAVETGAAALQERFLLARIEPTSDNVDRLIEDEKAAFERLPQAIVLLLQSFGEFNREEELFPLLTKFRHPEMAGWISDVLFRPPLREFWHHPRFMAVAQKMGLLDYWNVTGKWPDFCNDSDLPYDCKTEAAKYG